MSCHRQESESQEEKDMHEEKGRVRGTERDA